MAKQCADPLDAISPKRKGSPIAATRNHVLRITDMDIFDKRMFPDTEMPSVGFHPFTNGSAGYPDTCFPVRLPKDRNRTTVRHILNRGTATHDREKRRYEDREESGECNRKFIRTGTESRHRSSRDEKHPYG